ncbi:MAG TPA: type I 3-dehydroquinate dehydratase, partial [Thermoanaerobaculia bacterium]
MRLFVTIFEETAQRALDAIRLIDADHDGVEIRAERFALYDFRAFRAATSKPIIFTRRGLAFDGALLANAIGTGIELVDVEFVPGLRLDDRFRSHVVLSHHDFDGMPDVEALARHMLALGCAHLKIAVTPQNFADNERLLQLLSPALRAQGSALSVIGMGERGLYSRILAPFKGSELQFVSRTEDRAAAPGQLSLHRAHEIYGAERGALRADRVFAVVGNPAGHSRSPAIHNALFREKRVPAAYAIASIESFDQITGAFTRGEPCGLSVTVPFKLDAYRFAQSVKAEIGENAKACEAANTLVNRGRGTGGRMVADNTDVDGFATILGQVCGRDRKSVAIVGAGGTARAALVAARRANMHVTVFNRTEGKGNELAER